MIALLDAWLFLRRAEHRVQMVDGRQTHRMPPSGERRLLARGMGLVSEGAFEETLSRHRDLVSNLFSNLLGASTGRSLIWITHGTVGLEEMDEVLDLTTCPDDDALHVTRTARPRP